jgi:hypothetical protein
MLKKMAKKGLITLHNQTGTKITGLYGGKAFTCTYVDEGKHSFQFGAWNEIYVTKYVSGCFCPYVFRVRDAYAAFTHNGEFAFILSNPDNRNKIDSTKYYVERI